MHDHDDKAPSTKIITLPDANGNGRDFALMTLVELEEGMFAVVAAGDELESDGPNVELYAYKYEENAAGGIHLDEIEDEAILETVFALADQMLADDDDADDDDGGDEDGKDDSADDA